MNEETKRSINGWPLWLVIVAVVLVVNAYDLATSLSLHGADQMYPLPAKPTWLFYTQLALLIPFAPVAIWITRWLLRTVHELPFPAAGRIAIMVVLFVQLGHVFFRTEHYPFSAVTMFSNWEPPKEPRSTRRIRTFLVEREGRTEMISFFREGNPYFARYLGFDYKSGWILGTFSQQNAETQGRVAKFLEDHGAVNPRSATVEVELRTGAFREVPPATRGEP